MQKPTGSSFRESIENAFFCSFVLILIYHYFPVISGFTPVFDDIKTLSALFIMSVPLFLLAEAGPKVNRKFRYAPYLISLPFFLISLFAFSSGTFMHMDWLVYKLGDFITYGFFNLIIAVFLSLGLLEVILRKRDFKKWFGKALALLSLNFFLSLLIEAIPWLNPTDKGPYSSLTFVFWVSIFFIILSLAGIGLSMASIFKSKLGFFLPFVFGGISLLYLVFYVNSHFVSHGLIKGIARPILFIVLNSIYRSIVKK